MRTGNYQARKRPAARGAQSRLLRIIGGAWRGRRFRFPDVPDIRPTPDRVRETLFNWLGPGVKGARCLDLFAGSGALGLEALSRGAARVLFVEQAATAVTELEQRLLEWNARDAQVVRSDALQYLRNAPPGGDTFDIVFLDPPFAQGMLPGAARLLEEHGWLADHALIYIEAPARDALPPLPAGWRQMKAKQAGEVGYHLHARGERGGAAT